MDASKAEFAHIGKSVVIKGQLSGSEDLFVDGVVEGTIELQGNSLVIGPNGKVRASVNAKGVVVQGKLEGDIHASERVELRKSGSMIGDVFSQRVAIEDGAYLRGKVDIQREGAKSASSSISRPENPSEIKSTAASVPGGSVPARGASASVSAVSAGTPVTKI
jgi:cytoskeletal protein CcmA (bactofilin family)